MEYNFVIFCIILFENVLFFLILVKEGILYYFLAFEASENRSYI